MRKKQWVLAALLLSTILWMCGCKKQSNPTDNVVAKKSEEEMISIHLGEISQEVSPFFYATEGDEKLLSFIFLKMSEHNNKIANENAVGDIQVIRKEKSTIYEISIGEGWRDSRGKEITADDLLHNYMLRCETGYRGIERVNQMKIKGLKEYQLDASKENCKKKEKEVKRALLSPDKKLKQKLEEELIIPALKREYAWIESLYEQENQSITGKYPKPQQLFSKFFAADVTYHGKNKTKEAVIREIAGQYKGDYQALSEITETDYEAVARCIAIESLFPDKQSAGKEHDIEGIRKKDAYAIEIETMGYTKEDEQILSEIYLVPKEYAGEEDPEEILSVGTGKYTAQRVSGKWVMQANPYFPHQKPFVASLQIKE